MSLQLRQCLATEDEATGDRLADAVVVLPDRLDQVLAVSDALRAEGVEALAQVPAVVAALDQDVDLLVQVLADLAGPQLPGLSIEGHPPDVAQSVAPDLRPPAETVITARRPP